LAGLGCGGPTVPTTKTTTTAAGPRLEVDSIREDLRKPFADPGQLKLVLDQLNANDPPKTPLDADTIKALREKLHFTDADIVALNRSEFGPLDSYVLHQALFFLYASDTLEVKSEPTVARAMAALEWVVRHVMIDDTTRPPDPPVWVALRG